MCRISYLIVGSGYRSMFYARVAARYPSVFRAMYLCRSQEKASLVSRETGIPASCDMEECLAFRPDFVVVVVNKQSIADVAAEWLRKGFPVLTETPPAMNKEQLLELWKFHKEGARLQVAEQYHRYPELAAGLRAVREGLIGTPSSAYLSLAHDYHGFSLLRRMLLTDGESYVIRGQRSLHPVTETDSRTGPVPGNPVREKPRDVFFITFDSGKTAVYDFSGVQYHSFIRSRHLTVRGDCGEWHDKTLLRLDSEGRPVREVLLPAVPERYRELDTGELRDLRRTMNPEFVMDNHQDEFAIASMLYDMRDYIDGGAEVYPLREALDDAYFRILLEEAAAAPWKEVRPDQMPWNE